MDNVLQSWKQKKFFTLEDYLVWLDHGFQEITKQYAEFHVKTHISAETTKLFLQKSEQKLNNKKQIILSFSEEERIQPEPFTLFTPEKIQEIRRKTHLSLNEISTLRDHLKKIQKRL